MSPRASRLVLAGPGPTSPTHTQSHQACDRASARRTTLRFLAFLRTNASRPRPGGLWGGRGRSALLAFYQPRVTDRLRLARFSVEGSRQRVTTPAATGAGSMGRASPGRGTHLILPAKLGVPQTLLDDFLEARSGHGWRGNDGFVEWSRARGGVTEGAAPPARPSCPELVRARFEWPYPVRQMVTQNAFEGLVPCLLSIRAGRGGSEKEKKP